jgi:hypothetical protein
MRRASPRTGRLAWAASEFSGSRTDKPWYDTPYQPSADGTTVESNDIPCFTVDEKDPDGKYKLGSMKGAENFTTWLVARKADGSQTIPLRWATWRVHWVGTWSPDYSTFTGGSAAFSGMGVGAHGTPKESGSTANEIGATLKWEDIAVTGGAPSAAAPNAGGAPQAGAAPQATP